jgi:ankyrin repeat protein
VQEDHKSLAFYIILLEQALFRWPQRTGAGEVYRGVALGEDDIDLYRERKGEVVSWAGFASASRSPRVAERFATNVLFVIHTRDRPYVGPASALAAEQEVLLANRTCRFIVEGVTTDPRTGRAVIALRDFQCFEDYDRPLTPEETRELVSYGLKREFGEKEGLVLLDGPIGQARVAERLGKGTRAEDGESLSRVLRLGSEVWRKDRARWDGEVRAAEAEAERMARVNVGLMLRGEGRILPGLAARLIAIGADLEAANDRGDTPLMIAAHDGDWRSVKLLLDAGANARAVHSGNGCTVLHCAVIGGNVRTVRVLLSADAAVDALCQGGFAPLMYGVSRGAAATVALLLRAGADPSRTGGGVTPLQRACELGLLEVASLLLRAGADPTARDSADATALHIAISKGHAAIVRLLLTVTEVEEPGPNRATTPLHTALDGQREEIVGALLEAGADVTRLSPHGFTPLHLAATVGSVALTRMLLSAGIHPDDMGRSGVTPVQACAIRPARNEGVLDCIRTLIDAGADLSKRGMGGMTALAFACVKGDIEVVKLLLKAGSPVSLPDNCGRSPLHWAAEHGHSEVVGELVAWGARLDALDMGGRTPLLVAMLSENADVIHTLRGATTANIAVSRARPSTPGG